MSEAEIMLSFPWSRLSDIAYLYWRSITFATASSIDTNFYQFILLVLAMGKISFSSNWIPSDVLFSFHPPTAISVVLSSVAGLADRYFLFSGGEFSSGQKSWVLIFYSLVDWSMNSWNIVHTVQSQRLSASSFRQFHHHFNQNLLLI